MAAPAGAAGRRVLAIDGPSGSGKTTLAEQLAVHLDPRAGAGIEAGIGAGIGAGPRPASMVTVVHLDDLYPGWDGLEEGVDRALDGVLRPLAGGRPEVVERRWDWQAGRDAEPVTVPATEVTMVEGVGSGALRCAPFLSLLIWLDGPAQRRRERALARDGEMFAPHWDRWAAQERAHFARERTRDRADIVLDETQVNHVHGAG